MYEIERKMVTSLTLEEFEDYIVKDADFLIKRDNIDTYYYNRAEAPNYFMRVRDNLDSSKKELTFKEEKAYHEDTLIRTEINIDVNELLPAIDLACLLFGSNVSYFSLYKTCHIVNIQEFEVAYYSVSSYCLDVGGGEKCLSYDEEIDIGTFIEIEWKGIDYLDRISNYEGAGARVEAFTNDLLSKDNLKGKLKVINKSLFRIYNEARAAYVNL